MAEQNTIQTIESHDLSLSKLLTDYYVVPSYQREYVWKTEQVERLLLDVHDAFPDKEQPLSEYFIGSMVVCPGPDAVLELIDGQQRMTTSYLFLCAVRDHLTAVNEQRLEALVPLVAGTHMNDYGEEVPRFRVALQYEDSLGLLEGIARGEVDLAEFPRKTRSVDNILNAYETIRSFLNAEFSENVSELKRFCAYFINRVKLVRIKTQDVNHALKVFETINDRGIGLDSMDLLKNLMFIRARKADFDDLKDKWKSLVDGLYAAGEKPLRFLRYFIFASYNVERLREEEIYGWFVRNEAVCGYGKEPLRFVEQLGQAAAAYVDFVKGRNADGSPNRYLANIGYLSGAARQHVILLLASRHLPIAEFTELCRQLENLFFAYIVTREPTREFERSFARWAPQLREVRDRAGLDDFLGQYFQPAKQSLAARFELAFKELSESFIQKYRMRYILGKLTQDVNEGAYEGKAQNLADFVKSEDVEHILPQTPPQEVLAGFDKPDEIQDYIRRLGNLTILESSIDSSISNKPYAQKRNAYRQSNFLLTRVIAEKVKVGKCTRIDEAVKGLHTFEEWTSASIGLRQDDLGRLAKRIWEMP